VKLYEWYTVLVWYCCRQVRHCNTHDFSRQSKASVNKVVRNLNLGVMKVEYRESHSDLSVLWRYDVIVNLNKECNQGFKGPHVNVKSSQTGSIYITRLCMIRWTWGKQKMHSEFQ
jgi:hypothetical protein